MEYKGNKVWGVKIEKYRATICRCLFEIIFFLAPGILAIIGAFALTAHNEGFLLYYNYSGIDVYMAIYGIIACIVYVYFTRKKPFSPVAAFGVVLYMIAYYVFAGHYGSIVGYVFLSIGCVICLICCISSVVRFIQGKWRQYYEAPCQSEILRIEEREKEKRRAAAEEARKKEAAEKAKLRAIAEETKRKEEAKIRAREKQKQDELWAQKVNQQRKHASKLAYEQKQEQEQARLQALNREKLKYKGPKNKNQGVAVAADESQDKENAGISDNETSSEPKGIRKNKESRRSRD